MIENLKRKAIERLKKNMIENLNEDYKSYHPEHKPLFDKIEEIIYVLNVNGLKK